MADKPSRALVLYGDGLARAIGPAQNHLHSFGSRAFCGFLALPHSPPSENEETRVIRELAELLDANETFVDSDAKELVKDESQERHAFPAIAERFMGMKAAVITENLSLKAFGSKLGFTMLHWNELCEDSDSLSEVPILVSGLLKLLGFQDGEVLDSSQFDLVFVHVGNSEKMHNHKGVELVDHLVGNLLLLGESKADISSRLHISIIMSYGALQEQDISQFSISDATQKNDGELSVLVPRQSYMMKGGKPREKIRQHCPMLIAQYQNAVTRRDTVKAFSFRDFIEHGGNLIIPADRFLHEVAFKLWKAPKYGA